MKSRITSECVSICYLFLFCFSLETAEAQNSCCNLLTNGDFELGDTGFTSDLTQDCNCIADSYCVGTNFQVKCGGWQNVNGNGGSGQFLIIDGSTGGPVDVWQNSVVISDEGEYCFSFWVASQYTSAFDLGFMVDGALQGGPFTVSQSTPIWTEYSGTVYLTPGTSNIAIRQLTGGGERDFGIDDISFGGNVNAGFIVDLSINCGAHLQFVNISTGPAPLSYTWDFGDPASGSDNFSNQQHPNHLYTSCGEFEVCLIVTNGECTDIICQIVIVDEVVAPNIICPPFIVLDCDDDLSPGTTGFATATDNCDLNPNIQYSDAPFGNIPCGGEIIRTWTATDFCGNVATCDQNIIVFDDVPPGITCPSNVIVTALPPECKVEVNGIQWITNTDNCGIPTVDYLITGAGAIPAFGIKDASGAEFNVGVSTVSYISTDQCGNKDTCMFTVTVNCMMQGSCVCSASGNSKPNLVVNGDFELGDNFFTTDLITGPQCVSGSYSVGNDFPVQCNLWPAGVFDHTSGTGNFMIIDGNSTTAPTVWSQSVTVVPGKTYELCFWTASVYCDNQQDFTLNLVMQGFDSLSNPVSDTMGQEIIVEPCPPPGQSYTPTWIQHNVTWTCPPSLVSGFNLEINQVAGTFGDLFTDFGLDDICFTEATVPSDTCCKDLQAFCDDLEAGIIFSEDLCKVTMDLSALPLCYLIEWVDWGQGPEFGPWTPTTFPPPMHSFSGPGTYPISYLAIAYNDSNFICLEKVMMDSISVQCADSCICSADEFTLDHNGVTYVLSCDPGSPIPTLSCPIADVWVGGFFGCASAVSGELCDETPVNWSLTGPGNNIINSGVTTPFTQFIFPASMVGVPGNYTLTLSTLCPGAMDTCSCVLQWIQEDCGPECPDNMVQNPGFYLGAVPGNLNGAGQSSNWTTYGGSPQVSNSDFCADPYFIQMHDGEGICQTGFNFLQGHTYRVSFCGRFWEDTTSFATSVNFAFVGANGCGGPNVETIGGSGSISNQNWATYTLPDWTPSQNLNTMWIRVFNVLGYTTFGRIDNICIEEVLPDTCYCGGFEDMFVRTPQGAMNMAVACGGPPITIPCPDPGKGFYLTGVFGCEGNACPPDHQVDWSLVHQGSGTTHSGSFQDDDAFFTMYILPTYISQPGLYTLSLTGYCNGDTCVCELQFIIDCPDLCPCDISDILSFSANVDKGYAVALANQSCKACFSPMAISDCESVEWYVNSTSGSPIGTSNGNQTFCYTFPFSGNYTVYMVVTRLKPDGTICEVFTYSKTITVSCLKASVCDKSIWPNPGFSEGAVACMSGQDGVSEGWVGEGPSLAVLEGVEGSDDGWSVLLTGCYFSSDRLAAMKPVCTGREDKGTLVIRMRSSTPNTCCLTCRPKFSSPSGNKLTITIDDGKNVGCKGEKGCHCIAEIVDLIPTGEDDWYDVYIPYDLSEWEPTDSCGDESLGSPAILNIWMSNMLSADQGDGLVRDAVIIDQICMGGTLVSTDNPRSPVGYRLFPNPTTGSFRVELPNPAKTNTRLRVIGLTGQVLKEQSIPEGSEDYLIDTETLAPGMYFVEVLHQGQRQAVFKVVKQTL